MTGKADVFGWLTYIPKHYFRDVLPVVDPHHADALRERDLEIYEAHGIFCRRPIPGEFPADAPLKGDDYVVVHFRGDVYHKLLAERDGAPRRAPMIRQRRGGRR